MSQDDKLSPKRRLVIGAFTVAMAAAGFATGRTALRPAQAIAQPIQFNHQKHVKTVGLDCSTCHEYVETRQHAGLPSLEVCESCHEEPQTQSAEEEKLRTLIASKPQTEFRKLFRLPDHVFYSHRRHVAVAALPCETCHGAIAETTAPPTRALVRITMDTCVGCHTEKRVKVDCTNCHQ